MTRSLRPILAELTAGLPVVRERASEADQAALFRRAQTDPPDAAARDRLIAMHLPFAVKLARKFLDRGLDPEDVIQEGLIGLADAIRRFDPDRDRRFTTYATHYVEGYIKRAIVNHGRLVRVPAHVPGLPDDDPRRREMGRQTLGGEALARIEVPDREPADEGFPEKLDRLREALRSLPPTERRVILHRHQIPTMLDLGWIGQPDVWRFRDIAERVGVSHMTVQRVEKQGLRRLMVAMRKLEEDGRAAS